MPSHNLYHLVIRKTDGSAKQLTGYPMSHADCCTMKSKFSDADQARIQFVPAANPEPLAMPSATAIAAAKEIHAQQWHGLTYDEMIHATAQVVDKAMDALAETLTRQQDCLKSNP